jgi:hypothetical protein
MALEGTNFTIQVIQSSYPQDPVGPVNGSSPLGLSTYNGELNKELYFRGSSGLSPDVIMKGWQEPYVLGFFGANGF